MASSVSSFASWKELFTSQRALCTLPILVVVVIASLDNADKQLLASSFPMLEQTLGLDVQTLGYFSLFANLSYALSLPLWGYLVHKYGLQQIPFLLGIACTSWGLATMGIAWMGSSFVGQAICRSLVGVALGSILPLSQTLLVELVEVSMRGRAFGLLNFCEKLAGTLAAASVVYMDAQWKIPYYVLGVLSILMGYIAWTVLSPTSNLFQIHRRRKKSYGNRNDDAEEAQALQLSLRQIIHRIVSMPPFLCMVAQGIFGGTPWDMMSFLLLLMEWRGFAKSQMVSIQFTSGLTGTIGSWLGGYLGDYASTTRRWGTQGRIGVALISVLGGLPFYGLFLHATSYKWALLWFNAFHLWGSWTQAGALRPICADLTRNPSERAQIVSLWIVLEKLSGAIFGAPLVGYLTKHMLASGEEKVFSSDTKANALAWNLFLLSSLFWGICAFFWALMSSFVSQRPDLMDTRRILNKETKEVELNPLL